MYSPCSNSPQALHLKHQTWKCLSKAIKACPSFNSSPQPGRKENLAKFCNFPGKKYLPHSTQFKKSRPKKLVKLPAQAPSLVGLSLARLADGAVLVSSTVAVWVLPVSRSASPSGFWSMEQAWHKQFFPVNVTRSPVGKGFLQPAHLKQVW